MIHPFGNEVSTFISFQKSEPFKGLSKVKIHEHNVVRASKGRGYPIFLFYLGDW